MTRELDDAKVARAMGWTLRESGYPVQFWVGTDGLLTGYCDRPWPAPDDPYDDTGHGDAPGLFSGKGVFSPFTDIAAAWEVVEWKTTRPRPEQTWRFALEKITSAKKPLRWFAYWWGEDPYDENADAEADTAPEAICLSFLATVD